MPKPKNNHKESHDLKNKISYSSKKILTKLNSIAVGQIIEGLNEAEMKLFQVEVEIQAKLAQDFVSPDNDNQTREPEEYDNNLKFLKLPKVVEIIGDNQELSRFAMKKK